MGFRFLTAAALFATGAAAQPLQPAWVPELKPMSVEIVRDPITDSVSAFAVAQGDKSQLRIGCAPDQYRGIRVYVVGREWLDANHRFTRRATLRHRFDDAPAERSSWRISGRTASLRPLSLVPDFIDRVLNSDRVTFRARNLEDREFDTVYSLRDRAAAINLMLETCRQSEARRLSRR
ncbi:MAG TPA: hypothetical protein VNT25_03735 [Allosphingosinicella sp.]|nr:hypothetical protein [Allosphingosinicella sp.]